MTKVLAKELAEDGINVNAIAPGIVGTPATKESLPDMMQEMLVMNTPMQRMGEPGDMLGVLEFLSTPPATT